jgi:hypothetical protein
MANYLLLVQVDCADPSRENEFNKWYDEIHLPDMIKAPGLVKATRYLNLSPDTNKRPKYVTLYEIEAEDIDAFEKTFHECATKAEKAGRMINILASERFYPMQPPYYKQITSIKKSDNNKITSIR